MIDRVRSIAICKNSNKKKGLMSSCKTQSTFDFTIYTPLVARKARHWRREGGYSDTLKSRAEKVILPLFVAVLFFCNR